jgi:hypothetical protein
MRSGNQIQWDKLQAPRYNTYAKFKVEISRAQSYYRSGGLTCQSGIHMSKEGKENF